METSRRKTDSVTDISMMIANENDPKQRAFLIVLNSINLALEANTATVREISQKLEHLLDDFNNHVTEDERLVNQGRGAWKVVAWVIGIAQVMATGAWVTQRNEISDLTKAVQAELIGYTQVRTRVDVLEKTVASHIDASTRKGPEGPFFVVNTFNLSITTSKFTVLNNPGCNGLGY